MNNLVSRAIGFIKSASYTRTLTVLSILVILAAIPLTVYISQREQDIRQRASSSECTNCTTLYDQCQSNCATDKQNAENAANNNWPSCTASCNQQFTEDTPEWYSCNNTCNQNKQNALTEANTTYGTCNQTCSNRFTSCNQTYCTGSPSQPVTCTGIEPVNGIRTEYQCQTVSNDTCVGGWTRSQRSDKTCGPSQMCCYRDLGPVDTQPPGSNPPGDTPPASGDQPAPTIAATVTPAPTQASSPPAGGVAPGGSSGAACGDNPAGSNPPANYKWAANCSRSCTSNSDCPQSTDGYVNPSTSNWCYGFGSSQADWRCMQLTYTGPRTSPTAQPTVNPGQAPACDTNQLNMSAFPSSPQAGASVSLSLSGNQGSTHVGDTIPGATNCSFSGQGFWGNATCTFTNAGIYTWTHTWRNCAPSNCNVTSAQCSKALTITVGGGGGTTPTVNPTAGPTTAPTTAPSVTPPTSGGALFNVTLTLSAINAGRNITTPTRPLNVELFDATGQQVDSARIQQNATVAYNSSTGKFTGSVLVNPLSGGNYTMKIKTGRYLKKLVPGILVVPATTTQTATVTVPETTLIVGDMSNDNRVDIQDYNMLIGCFGNKANTSSCTSKTNADLDDNNVVDEVDFNIFVRSLAIQSGD